MRGMLQRGNKARGRSREMGRNLTLKESASTIASTFSPPLM
ncbi:MAG: hypothetical protein Q8P67_06595 [archaeon]|nr:hypothetical protein [archaeon]